MGSGEAIQQLLLILIPGIVLALINSVPREQDLMYAAHFAAALAVKGPRVSAEAPAWALPTAAFVPDLAWIALARLGVEPELPPSNFLRLVALASYDSLFWLQSLPWLSGGTGGGS